MTSEKDNTYFDYLIALLNYKELFSFPENEELKDYVSEFIELLEGGFNVYSHTYGKLYDEIMPTSIRRRSRIDWIPIFMTINWMRRSISTRSYIM